MSETKPARADHGAYVRKVQEDTQNFAQGLIGEVERLRVLVAALESEKEGLATQLRDVETVIRANDSLRAQIEGIRAETQAYSSRYAEVEQQNSNLANLYVASYRLHGTLDRQEVIAAIQEIIANLVGSEEAALFEIDSDTQTLELVASFGLDREQCPSIPLGRRPHRPHRADGGDTGRRSVSCLRRHGLESRLTACVPLKLDAVVTGVVAIFGLLPQKGGIEDLDRELFDLLATQAAFALYCTGLHAKVALEVARRW